MNSSLYGCHRKEKNKTSFSIQIVQTDLRCKFFACFFCINVCIDHPFVQNVDDVACGILILDNNLRDCIYWIGLDSLRYWYVECSGHDGET